MRDIPDNLKSLAAWFARYYPGATLDLETPWYEYPEFQHSARREGPPTAAMRMRDELLREIDAERRTSGNA